MAKKSIKRNQPQKAKKKKRPTSITLHATKTESRSYDNLK